MKNDNRYRLSKKDIKSKEFLIPFIVIVGISIAGIIIDHYLNLKGKLVVLIFIEYVAFVGIVLIFGGYAKMKNKKFSPKFSRSIIIVTLTLIALIYIFLYL